MVKERLSGGVAVTTIRLIGETKPRRVRVPRVPAPTPEEIERRRRIFAETMELRKQAKPPAPGHTVDDYIRQMREED